jgi:hypothetical protein
VRSRALASTLLLAACGRIDFDLPAEASPPPGEAYACGQTSRLTRLPAAPSGIAVAGTTGGVVVAWSQGTPDLSGVWVPIGDDGLGAVEPWTSSVPYPIGDFGLVTDDGDRYLLSVLLPNATAYVALDSTRAVVTSRMINGRRSSNRGAAPPLVREGLFTVAGIEGTDAAFVQLEADLRPVGTSYSSPGSSGVSIRGAGGRHYATWASAGSGCAAWAFEQDFTPSLLAPVTLPEAGACQQPLMARSDDTNLLVWLDGGQARGQRGSDTAVLGDPLSFGAPTDGLEVAAVAADGFITAAAAGGRTDLWFVPRLAGDPVPLAPVPHRGATPIRLIERGDDALLVSLRGEDEDEGGLRLQLTRVCRPR